MQAPSTNNNLRKKWLDALSSSRFNGCGHVRLQLDDSKKDYYSVDNSWKSGVRSCNGIANAANCIDSSVVASRMIRRFFE